MRCKRQRKWLARGVCPRVRGTDRAARSAEVQRPTGTETGLDLADIHGDIVPGLNKDYQAFLLVRFRGRAEEASWLSALRPQIASAAEVAGFRSAFKSMKERRKPEDSPGRDGGALRGISATWLNVALSFAGLRQV